MAEVFIHRTKPTIVDENWPPKIEEPVQSDRVSFFPPSPQPIIRSDAPIILGLPPTREEEDKTPVTVGSTETRFTANLEPISNERNAGTIYGEGATQTQVNLPKPPNPVGNTEVKLWENPGPIRNDLPHTIMFSPASNFAPTPGNEPSPHNTVSNEQPRFTYMNQSTPNFGDKFIPQPAEPLPQTLEAPPPWERPLAPQSNGVLGHVTAGNKDVQIIPGRPANLPVASDTTFGGGGDPTKMPGQDDRTFAGQSTLNVGASDTFLAASGDNTRQANESDRVLTPNVGALGNHEILKGSTGGASVGDREVGFGGKNKPKNVRG